MRRLQSSEGSAVWAIQSAPLATPTHINRGDLFNSHSPRACVTSGSTLKDAWFVIALHPPVSLTLNMSRQPRDLLGPFTTCAGDNVVTIPAEPLTIKSPLWDVGSHTSRVAPLKGAPTYN